VLNHLPRRSLDQNTFSAMALLLTRLNRCSRAPIGVLG
jgi:hypothetical protein